MKTKFQTKVKMLGMFLVLICLGISCTKEERIEPVLAKIYAYQEQRIAPSPRAGITLATFNNAPLEAWEILQYEVFYLSSTSVREESFTIPPDQFFVLNSSLLTDAPIYGIFRKNIFRSKKALLDYRTNFLKINMIRSKMRYKINNVWYETIIEDTYTDSPIDPLWL